MVNLNPDPFLNPAHNPFGHIPIYTEQHPARYIYDRSQGNDYLDLLRSNHETALSGGQCLQHFDPFENHMAESLTVLNLACGWHPWAWDFARLNPEVEVICADMDRRPLAFARSNARARRLDNCETFHEIDITEMPLPYPKDSFHLVVLEDPFSFLRSEEEDKLWAECARILIPGGFFLIKESDWVSNSSSLSSFQRLRKMALAADRRSIDLLTRAPGLARQVGLTEISAEDLMIQIVPAVPGSGYSNFRALMYYEFQTIRSFLLKSGLIDGPGLDRIWQDADDEVSLQGQFQAAYFQRYIWACEDLTI